MKAVKHTNLCRNFVVQRSQQFMKFGNAGRLLSFTPHVTKTIFDGKNDLKSPDPTSDNYRNDDIYDKPLRKNF